MANMSKWDIVYRSAINPDGSLFFPERLTKKFLDEVRQSMGSYLFANQYQNIIIPDDEKVFKSEWLRSYKQIPEPVFNYGFIDPAIGQKDHHDYTGVSIISVDIKDNWYLIYAHRFRWTPTEIVSKMFDLCSQFKLRALGIETVAYQESLLYFLSQEMRQRKRQLPVHGITRKAISKNTRILGLVPRFEWGRIFINQGMRDFEDEYASFPRGSHDDILDALASLDELITLPSVKKERDEYISPHHPKYESRQIRRLAEQANELIEEKRFFE